MCDPTGFRFELIDGAHSRWCQRHERPRAVMGDLVKFAPGMRLVAEFPAPCRIRLIKSGKLIDERSGTRIESAVRSPGVYRVEGWLELAGEERGWLYSNPDLRTIDLTADQAFGCRAGGNLLDDSFKPAEVDGFGEVNGEPGRQALLDVARRAEARERDPWNRLAGANGFHQLKAAAIGELDVADQHVAIGFGREPKTCGHVAGGGDVVAAASQHRREEGERVGIVVDEQDLQAARRGSRRRSARSGRRGAPSGSAAGSDTVGISMVNVAPSPGPRLAAVSLPPCPSMIERREQEPQPQAAEPPACGGSPLLRDVEDPVDQARVDANTRVAHLHQQGLAVMRARSARAIDRAHGHAAAGRGELDRVLDQVPERLLEANRVGTRHGARSQRGRGPA